MFDERGEGGAWDLGGVGGVREGAGDPTEVGGRGGRGCDSRFAVRRVGLIFEKFSSMVSFELSVKPSSYSSFKAASPLEPVRLWPANSLCWRIRPSSCL